MNSHLCHAINALVSIRGITLSELATQIGLSQSALSKLAGYSRRPDEQSLKALCASMVESRDGLDLLTAHLRDEIERAGRLQSEISISVEEREAPADIRLIEERCRTDSELRAIVHDLAELVRAQQRKESRGIYIQPEPANLVAAEDKPTHLTVDQILAAEKKRRSKLRPDHPIVDAGRKVAPISKTVRRSSP